MTNSKTQQKKSYNLTFFIADRLPKIRKKQPLTTRRKQPPKSKNPLKTNKKEKYPRSSKNNTPTTKIWSSTEKGFDSGYLGILFLVQAGIV